jgi:hypothetical protein
MAQSRHLTLLDVIQAVSEIAANEQEMLATVVHLIRSGQGRRCDKAIRAIRGLLARTEVAASRFGGTHAMRRAEIASWGARAEALLIMGIFTFLLLV